MTVDSRSGAGATPPASVAAPSNLAGKLVVKNKKTSTVTLTWVDNATNEAGFLVQRINPDGTVVNATVGPNVVTFTEAVGSGVSYRYRVHAFSDTAQSGWSNTVTLP